MARAPRVSGISHVAMCVRNVDRSLAFYRDLLGLRVIKDDVQDTRTGGLPHVYRDRHAQRRVVHLRYGDGPAAPFLVITGHLGDEVGGEPIMLDQVGISHISFTVPDIEAFTRYLLTHGVEPAAPPDAFPRPDGRIRTAFFRDPDGILVQFDEGSE